jgi:hypothetical protein
MVSKTDYGLANPGHEPEIVAGGRQIGVVAYPDSWMGALGARSIE